MPRAGQENRSPSQLLPATTSPTRFISRSQRSALAFGFPSFLPWGWSYAPLRGDTWATGLQKGSQATPSPRRQQDVVKDARALTVTPGFPPGTTTRLLGAGFSPDHHCVPPVSSHRPTEPACGPRTLALHNRPSGHWPQPTKPRLEGEHKAGKILHLDDTLKTVWPLIVKYVSVSFFPGCIFSYWRSAREPSVGDVSIHTLVFTLLCYLYEPTFQRWSRGNIINQH